MTPIALDRYVYEDIYPAFKAATDEKEKTSRINQSFLNHLATENLVLTAGQPILTADIGSGPCDTLIKYLSGVAGAAGFDVRATDYLAEYADPRHGKAWRNLAAAQAEGRLNLARFSVRAGDSFGGNLLDLVSDAENRPASAHAFRLVFASHVMYHAESLADVTRCIGDIAANLLDYHQGVAILYHIANTTGTFQEFRARYGSRSDRAPNSDTGAVTIDDPPARIAAACREFGLPLYELRFESGVRFGSLSSKEWRIFHDPLAYDHLAQENPTAYEDLKKLYFIVQRAPLEFADDRSETGLASFIARISRVIEENHGILAMAERMQVFCRADALDRLRKTIPQALAHAEAAALTAESEGIT